MNLQLDNTSIVHDHFKKVSSQWSKRYEGHPQRMSDLDLILRRRNVHHLIKPLIEANSRKLSVMDIGCGSGNLLDGFSRDTLTVIGIDFVHEMVMEASRTHPQDCFYVADATHLPVMTESLDIITCLGVLEYVPDPASILRTINRCLHPGGYLIVSYPNKNSTFRKISNTIIHVDRAFIAMRNRICRRITNEALKPKYVHKLFSIKQACQQLVSAGFDIDQILLNSYGLWGRAGNNSINLRFSQWMSQRLCRISPLSSFLACTMVLRARKMSF